MINITIQIEKKSEAIKLVTELLERALIAEATISEKTLYVNPTKANSMGAFTNIITAQTKALLFNTIVVYVFTNYANEVKIYSTPISQIDDNYSELIRSNTQKI